MMTYVRDRLFRQGVAEALLLVLLISAAARAANTTLLHSFSGKPDGRNPYGSPALSGETLFGMTNGGSADGGVLFRIITDGSGYAILHSFGDGRDDGRNPGWCMPTAVALLALAVFTVRRRLQGTRVSLDGDKNR